MTDRGGGQSPQPWWEGGVLYQIYPRSFADSDGDGNGDIRGIIEHLDHLSWLGVDGVWLSPVTVSPNADWGYDVTDFCAVQPDLGTMDEFDQLVAEASQRDIRVLMDLVPNHTSDQHPWFLDSRSSRTVTAARLVRVGRPQGRTARRPTTGSAASAARRGRSTRRPGSTTCTTTWPSSPTSTGGTKRSARPSTRILRFWFDRGVAGFRIDVCNVIIKDAELAGQPAGHRGRRLRGPDVRPALGVQRQPSRGPRGHPALATHRRLLRPAADPGRRDPGQGGRAGRLLRERARRAPPGLQLPLHRRAARGRPDAQRSSKRRRRASPTVPGRRGRDPTTTCRAWPPAGPRTTRSGPASPCCCCSACGGRPSSTRATRSGCRTGRWPRRSCGTPSGVALLALLRGARRHAHAHAVARRAPAAASPRRGHPLAPDRATRRTATSRTSVADRGSVLHLVRDLVDLRRRTADLRSGDYRPLDAESGLWAWHRGTSHRGCREPRR